MAIFEYIRISALHMPDRKRLEVTDKATNEEAEEFCRERYFSKEPDQWSVTLHVIREKSA